MPPPDLVWRMLGWVPKGFIPTTQYSTRNRTERVPAERYLKGSWINEKAAFPTRPSSSLPSMWVVSNLPCQALVSRQEAKAGSRPNQHSPTWQIPPKNVAERSWVPRQLSLHAPLKICEDLFRPNCKTWVAPVARGQFYVRQCACGLFCMELFFTSKCVSWCAVDTEVDLYVSFTDPSWDLFQAKLYWAIIVSQYCIRRFLFLFFHLKEPV
jgi:hypothetical protein